MGAYNIFEFEGFVFYGNETEAEIAWYEETRARVDFLSWCFENLRQVTVQAIAA